MKLNRYNLFLGLILWGMVCQLSVADHDISWEGDERIVGRRLWEARINMYLLIGGLNCHSETLEEILAESGANKGALARKIKNKERKIAIETSTCARGPVIYNASEMGESFKMIDSTKSGGGKLVLQNASHVDLSYNLFEIVKAMATEEYHYGARDKELRWTARFERKLEDGNEEHTASYRLVSNFPWRVRTYLYDLGRVNNKEGEKNFLRNLAYTNFFEHNAESLPRAITVSYAGGMPLTDIYRKGDDIKESFFQTLAGSCSFDTNNHPSAPIFEFWTSYYPDLNPWIKDFYTPEFFNEFTENVMIRMISGFEDYYKKHDNGERSIYARPEIERRDGIDLIKALTERSKTTAYPREALSAIQIAEKKGCKKLASSFRDLMDVVKGSYEYRTAISALSAEAEETSRHASASR